MSSNAQLVAVLSALVLIAVGVRVICGPWQGADHGRSMYAAAKLGAAGEPLKIEIELAIGDTIPARFAK